VPKNSSIRPSTSIEHPLVTDRHRTIASTRASIASRGKSYIVRVVVQTGTSVVVEVESRLAVAAVVAVAVVTRDGSCRGPAQTESTVTSTLVDVFTHTHVSTQPCIPPGSLNRVPASAGVKAGMSPLPGGR